MSDVRLIDADEVIRGMAEIMKSPWFNDDKYSRLAKLDSFHIVKNLCIDSAPTISAVPVVHGRWIEHPDDRCSLFNGWECSECKQIVSGGRGNYCPNCGAKMDAQDMDVHAKEGGAV